MERCRRAYFSLQHNLRMVLCLQILLVRKQIVRIQFYSFVRIEQAENPSFVSGTNLIHTVVPCGETENLIRNGWCDDSFANILTHLQLSLSNSISITEPFPEYHRLEDSKDELNYWLQLHPINENESRIKNFLSSSRSHSYAPKPRSTTLNKFIRNPGSEILTTISLKTRRRSKSGTILFCCLYH